MSAHSPTTVPSGLKSNLPSASLDILPLELITEILTHLTRADAISLALTARAFFLPAESRIWESLTLALQPHFGELPLVQPFARGEEGYKEWSEGVWRTAELWHRATLREKTRKLLLRGGAGRFGRVRHASLTPRVGNIYGMIQVLEMVSAHLETLEIRYRRGYLPEDIDVNLVHRSIDFKLIDAGLLFPRLTTIRLGSFALSVSDTILLLCALAPNLVTLDIDDQYYMPRTPSSALPCPTISADTKIKYLSLSFNLPDVPESGEDSDSDDGEDEEDETAEPLLQLLEYCPLLERLSVNHLGRSWKTPIRIFVHIADYNVTDLHWTADSDGLDFWTEEESPSSVRRLVVEPCHWYDVFLPPSTFPNLQVYCVMRSPYEMRNVVPIDTSSPPSQSTSMKAMVPNFAHALRASPHLDTIYTLELTHDERGLAVFDRLDEMEAAGTATGKIRSIRHDDLELLHATMLHEYEEVSDRLRKRKQKPVYGPWTQPLLLYTASDGTSRQKTFNRITQLTWHHYTDFCGHVVPLSIINKMMTVEGVTEAEWQGRGIEVRDKAWKVLMDWKDKKEGKFTVGERRSLRKGKKEV